jgi:hypothetical protein
MGLMGDQTIEFALKDASEQGPAALSKVRRGF